MNSPYWTQKKYIVKTNLKFAHTLYTSYDSFWLNLYIYGDQTQDDEVCGTCNAHEINKLISVQNILVGKREEKTKLGSLL